MAFPIDPGRPPGIQPLENLVPDQRNVDPRAMLPLAPAREQQHHDVRQHAGLGHVQHDEDMNLEDMLPLRQAINLDQDDAMLEDDNNQLREHSIHAQGVLREVQITHLLPLDHRDSASFGTAQRILREP